MCDHDVPVIALGGGSIDPAPPVATEVDGSLEPETLTLIHTLMLTLVLTLILTLTLTLTLALALTPTIPTDH